MPVSRVLTGKNMDLRKIYYIFYILMGILFFFRHPSEAISLLHKTVVGAHCFQ